MSTVKRENMKGYDRKIIYSWDFERTSGRNANYLKDNSGYSSKGGDRDVSKLALMCVYHITY